MSLPSHELPTNTVTDNGSPGISCRVFGQLPSGEPVHEYTLDNGAGLRLSALTLGGIVNGLWLPDRAGRSANVVLGFERLEDYLTRNPNFGVIVGRYANRIAGARFMLDGREVVLESNDGPNNLHGGSQGFGTRLWQAEVLPGSSHEPALRLSLVSADGDQGFPGRVDVSVDYRLTADGAWQIDYRARSDAPTLVNLSHHDYFNLAGHGSALGHQLQLSASRYCEVGPGLIPTGIAPVQGTPFDFRQPALIEQRLRQQHPQLALAGGYDHHWLLDDWQPAGNGAEPVPRPMAWLHDPQSGRTLSLASSAPGLQFYSGNFLDGRLPGHGSELYRQGDGVCLEPQYAPDSPHHPDDSAWPSCVLRPGQGWHSRSVYRFGAQA
jgi:aldose 1-epimerase